MLLWIQAGRMKSALVDSPQKAVFFLAGGRRAPKVLYVVSATAASDTLVVAATGDGVTVLAFGDGVSLGGGLA